MFSRSTAGESACDWMSWSSRHLWSSMGIFNLCYNLGIKKTIYLNSKSQTEMKFLCFYHINQSFSIHQAIWSGLLDVKRMRVDSKCGHVCSDLQHYRGGWGQDVLYRGALNNLCVRGRSEEVSRGWTWNVQMDKVVTFPACTSPFQHTRGFLLKWLWSLWTAITGPFWPQMTLAQAHVSPWASHYLGPCLD